MELSLKGLRQEYAFTWPTNGSMEDSGKIKLVCLPLERSRRQEIEMNSVEEVIDERTRKARRTYSNISDQLIEMSLKRIENLTITAEDGTTTLPPDRVREKWKLLFETNCGLDIDQYGNLEEEFTEWFSRKILRRSEDAKKNSRQHETPVTATSAAETGSPSGATKMVSGKTG